MRRVVNVFDLAQPDATGARLWCHCILRSHWHVCIVLEQFSMCPGLWKYDLSVRLVEPLYEGGVMVIFQLIMTPKAFYEFLPQLIEA